MTALRRVGLAAEHESPEDPAGSEVRVALTPAAVRQLADHGHDVAVESGAGRRMGFEDDEYRTAGAAIVSRDELYRDREVVIKLKGPAHSELATMDPGSLLICMAHVKSIPERAAICDERGINLLALELVTERPPRGEAYVRSRIAMERLLAEDGRPAAELHIAFAGFDADAFGALQHAARSHPLSLQMLASAADSTSRCGPTRRLGAASDVQVTVLGYGNVAFGAVDECMRSGVSHVHIRTERTNAAENYSIPLLTRDELMAYAGWHGEVRR